MKKNKIWRVLAAAGSFVVLTNSYFVMKPYAKVDFLENEFVISGQEECERLLMELVSAAETGVRQEYFLTGEDYEPETLVIAQMFPDSVNISNTKMREYDRDGHHYVTCRIGFQRGLGSSVENVPEEKEGEVNGRRWAVGDERSLKIGDRTYRFRCVDDDYGNDSDYQNYALFLCESVIRSDVDSTEYQKEILTFGTTNNYKVSRVRQWLEEETEAEWLVSVGTGVNSAFLGATVPGTYSEFSESAFLRHDLTVQSVSDRLFLLSLEEAFKYKDELWNVNGGESSYDRGYWLRTPAFSTGENGKFNYGTWEYMVDLDRGCIRPAEVADGSIGIRPAFCLPQA